MTTDHQSQLEPAKPAKQAYALRRARLKAARTYPWRSLCRKAILSGAWDSGAIAESFLNNDI